MSEIFATFVQTRAQVPTKMMESLGAWCKGIGPHHLVVKFKQRYAAGFVAISKFSRCLCNT